jgi:glycerol-3-phosphate dehydrogenase
MNVTLAVTAIQHGAVAVNHVEVVKLLKRPRTLLTLKGDTEVCGAVVRDVFTGEEWEVKAKVLGVDFRCSEFTSGSWS